MVFLNFTIPFDNRLVQRLYNFNLALTGTYDHRLWRTGHPVRSAIHKPQIGRLVVGSVTTSEYLLLYVFANILCLLRKDLLTLSLTSRTIPGYQRVIILPLAVPRFRLCSRSWQLRVGEGRMQRANGIIYMRTHQPSPRSGFHTSSRHHHHIPVYQI